MLSLKPSHKLINNVTEIQNLWALVCARIRMWRLVKLLGPARQTKRVDVGWRERKVTGCPEKTITQILLGKSFPIFLPKK